MEIMDKLFKFLFYKNTLSIIKNVLYYHIKDVDRY